jgi:hypothetical protein
VAELQQRGYDAVRLFREARSFYPQILARGIDSEPKPAAKPSTPMKYGRIVRVSERQGYTTYIVAEEDAAKAVALIRDTTGPGPVVQSIGRASLKLLDAVGLAAGGYKKAENY